LLNGEPRLAATPLDKVKADADLLRFAMAGAAAAFQANCAPCHGRGAQGFAGYPNLNDDDWLWGGSIDEIHKTISSGVRSEQKDTRASQMPRYGLDKLLDDKQINDAAEYVLSLSGKAGDHAAEARGKAIFAEQCAACHGPDGKGKQEQGAPNLTDAIWLYGKERKSIVAQIGGPLRTLSLSAAGRNLFTFTGYSGLDPEVSNFGNQPIGRNYDVAPYPPSRQFWFSVTAGL